MPHASCYATAVSVRTALYTCALDIECKFFSFTINTCMFTYMSTQYVTRHNEVRYKSEKINQLMQTEAGDFSIKFFRYHSTTSQRGLRALAGCWAISEELNREVTRFSLFQNPADLRLISINRVTNIAVNSMCHHVYHHSHHLMQHHYCHHRHYHLSSLLSQHINKILKYFT